MSIRIGLIDSGIDINHPLIAKKENIINGWKGEFDDFDDLLGHGTQCTHLILETADYLPKIYNIKVFDKKLKTSTRNIIKALQWCIDSQMKLINLSISVSDINYYHEFKKVCDEAYKKNTIIVASADNVGYPCLPAYLNNVFGVGIASVETDDDFFYNDSSIQLYANGSSLNMGSNNIISTSYATARMTGKIASILQENPDMNFDQLRYRLYSKSVSYNKNQILVKNEEIDLDKYTIPISLSKSDNVELITKELSDISSQHIVNNQKLVMALINLSNTPDIFKVELKFRDELMKRNHKVIQISSNSDSEIFDWGYSFAGYRQIPEKLHSAYAKALIESVNNNYSDAELIVIGMNKPILPSNLDALNFFNNYNVPEISMLYGFQIDTCILIVNELTEFRYIQRNIDCLKIMFDTNVMFLIYSSICDFSDKKTEQLLSNFEQIKRISENQFLELRKNLMDRLGLNIYNIDDEVQSESIYDEISNILS